MKELVDQRIADVGVHGHSATLPETLWIRDLTTTMGKEALAGAV